MEKAMKRWDVVDILNKRIAELESALRDYEIAGGEYDATRRRVTDLEAEKKSLRTIAMKTAAWLAMQSHNVEVDAIDLCERMRIKAIQVRKQIDEAIKEE